MSNVCERPVPLLKQGGGGRVQSESDKIFNDSSAERYRVY